MKKILIVGSGIVGSATGKALSHNDQNNVIFLDIDSQKVENLRSKKTPAYLLNDYQNPDFDVVLLTVPTPLKDGAIDLTYIAKAAEYLGEKISRSEQFSVVCVRSTVTPGTTLKLVAPILERTSGKILGKDFSVSMNPEYLREKTAVEDAGNPWIIVIGVQDSKTEKIMKEIYSHFLCEIISTSITQAELQKYIHNIFNANKIAFFNEFRNICEHLGCDADTLFSITVRSCEGLWNTEYGLKNMGPFSGNCLPKDTEALLRWSHENQIEMPILKAVIQSNKDLINNESAIVQNLTV